MTQKTNLHKLKWFWPWQDEAEERWLRQMSQQGWRLAKADLFGYYTFQAAPPADYVYRLDYQTPAKKEAPDYLQLFQDAGWEHVTQLANWYYFRKLYLQGEEPQIFTDVDSKIAKYQRLLETLAFPAAMLVLFMSMIDFGAPSIAEKIFIIIYAALFLVIALMVGGIAIKIDKLKKRS
jgi:hypothetical protein